jgi:uracil-DNA glycosylase
MHYASRPLEVRPYEEEVIPSLSVTKMAALANISYDEIAVALGVTAHQFSLEVQGVDEPLIANLTITPPIEPRGTVIAHSTPLLMQDRDGRIKYVWVRVRLW